jgi:hypothetical protein
MKLKLLSELATFIEALFTHAAPVVAQAAAGAAVASAESDPKVQAVTEASVALLAAAQSLKAAVANHPDVKAS